MVVFSDYIFLHGVGGIGGFCSFNDGVWRLGMLIIVYRSRRLIHCFGSKLEFSGGV